MPHPNEIKYKDDGRVDWSDIPVGAIIVSKGVPVDGVDYGHVCLYVGNGYVIEAGGSTITKSPIDDSYGGSGHNCAPFLGWGFAMTDQNEAKEKLVVTIGSGNYAQGWTPLEDASSTGIEGIFSVGDKEYKVYRQGGGAPWASRPYWDGTMSSDACGPTSVAIIATGYGNDVTPADTATQCEILMGLTPGVAHPGSGLGSHQNKTDALNYYGIEVSAYTADINYDKIKNHLIDGKPVLLSVSGNYGPRSTGGHFITLLGYDDLQDKAFLGDPVSGCSGWWDLDVVLSAAGHVWYIE